MVHFRRTVSLFAALVLSLGHAALAQTLTPPAAGTETIPVKRIAPLPEPGAIALYGPTGSDVSADEIWTSGFDQPWVRNVTHPTLTPFYPDPGKATGVAMIVLPGGGFQFNSIDNEGWGVARKLAAQGITAFVLKYRTEHTPDDERAFWAGFRERLQIPGRGEPLPVAAQNAMVLAREDAQAALRLVRANAAQWHLDPQRIGMIGFSAGAMTTLNTVLADAPDARPDFFAPIYGYMTTVVPPSHPQPMFVALAADDPLFGRQGFGLVEAWHRAGGTVELHYFSAGDHGFGVQHKGTTSDLWFDEFIAWLRAGKILR